MDSIDRQILCCLQQNARMSISEISANVNLSVPAVSERLKRLETAGVISKYTAILNPEAMNKKLTAFMFVSLERPFFIDGFVSFVSKQEEILECHYLAGDFDYLLKIITANVGTLENLLTKIKSVPGVQKTRTVVALATVKNNCSVTPTENG